MLSNYHRNNEIYIQKCFKQYFYGFLCKKNYVFGFPKNLIFQNISAFIIICANFQNF